MKLSSPQKEFYGKERLSALEAQRLAQEIAFGPVVFQVSRLMIKFGIFQTLIEHKKGLTIKDVAEKCNLPVYAAKVLMESSLTIGTILLQDEKFTIAKAGYFLLNDKMAKVNIDFNHDVNYLGLYYLEAALLNGTPEGLKVFGEWSTIYEGLSQLPPQASKSWFEFDHFYSDNSFTQALQIVFDRNNTKTLLDVGGNTGRWALKCVEYSSEAKVTVMDLPQQLELMKQHTSGKPGVERIYACKGNLLDPAVPFPKGFDALWMSQFLDCFSEEEVVSILARAAASMDEHCNLFIMETLWDRQHFETASYCITQISLYFTAMANGNSKMFYSGDLEVMILRAGLEIIEIYDGLGLGHSILQCKIKK